MIGVATDAVKVYYGGDMPVGVSYGDMPIGASILAKAPGLS